MKLRLTSKNGFTLVELLVVVAIVALISTSISVFYGKENAARAKRQMTIHEMHQIKQAFQLFYMDNEPQLVKGGWSVPGYRIGDPDLHTTITDTLSGSTGDRLSDSQYGVLAFFERFGLWPLLQPALSGFNNDGVDNYLVFKKLDPLTGEGWNGPYLDAPTRAACIADNTGLTMVDNPDAHTAVLPQMANRFNDVYRVIYFEHCEDDTDLAEPVYRRLLLTCSESNDYNSHDALLTFTGNRRSGLANAPYPLNLKTGAIESYDSTNGLFFVELLNLDSWRHN